MKAFTRLQIFSLRCCVFLCLALLSLDARAADTNALTLVKKILLPNVTGRIDHFAQDVKGQRLFVAATDNNTVEVIDLAAGKYAGTIGNCSTPKGLAFIPTGNRLVIVNSGSGTVKILDSISFKTLASFPNLPDADNVRYDAKTDLIYVGYGGGALAIIRATGGELVATIALPAHPESFEVEKNGNRIFVNLPGAQKVAVVNGAMQTVVETWWVRDSIDNFPMALDETNHRLFSGCRKPSRIVVLDTLSGNDVVTVDVSKDVDDLFYDASRKQIYASCGEGFIDVITQTDADTYELRQRIPTTKDARTSWFSPERSELYLAVPGSMISGSAEIRVFKCHP